MALLVLSLSVPKLVGQDGDYETAQKAWRAAREAKLMTDDGWFTMVSDDRPWFIFRNLTSGSKTYPSARFLCADAPDEKGWTTVNFNQAYNPSCTFNPYTTCPLPPQPHRLEVQIEAGELKNH